MTAKATKTLGARLREQEAERGKHGTVTARHLDRVGLDAFNKQEKTAQDFFTRVRETITRDIEAARKPTVMEMADHEPFRFGKTPINEAGNPYHYVWNEFEFWLEKNELRCELKWTHDGGGMRSWANVTISAVEPVKAP